MFSTTYKSQDTDDLRASKLDLEPLARRIGFIKRRSVKFSAEGFLLSLLKSLSSGHSSITRLSHFLAQHQSKGISKQALHQRFTGKSSDFVLAAVSQLIQSKIASHVEISNLGFNRVLVQDSTQVKLHPSHHLNYKGFGTQQYPKSGFKLDCCVDLLAKAPVVAGISSATTNDKQMGNHFALKEVKEGDLVIRDMGYYNAAIFKSIEEVGAYWLSRLPSSVRVKCAKSGTDLNVILESADVERIELDVYLSKQKKPVRLVAQRASLADQSSKIKKAHKAAKSQGKAQRAGVEVRNVWHILVTNVDNNKADIDTLAKLYALRWRIEIIFKAWKQSLNLKGCFSTLKNINHLKCLIYASLFWLVLTMGVEESLKSSEGATEISIQKLIPALSCCLLSSYSIQEVIHFRPDMRQVSYERRRRPTMVALHRNTLS